MLTDAQHGKACVTENHQYSEGNTKEIHSKISCIPNNPREINQIQTRKNLVGILEDYFIIVIAFNYNDN